MLHVAIAARAFRRYSTYTAATLAGIFTNSVFGVIYSYAYLALWAQRPDAGGYDATDAVTYVWLGQAMLMTVAFWGGGATDDLGDRIRSGDIAIDLYRPVGILGWYVASDLGRAAYHFLTRGVAPTIIGALLFQIRWPGSLTAVLGVAVSIVLAVLVSFAVRFLFACATFWLLDTQGLRLFSAVLAMFWGGMVLPLVIFPGVLKDIALALPWASYLQTPADIWLGKRVGWDIVSGLGLQALWAVVLFGCCSLVLRAATRKVVVQGG